MSDHNGSAAARRKTARELACLLAYAKAFWLMQSARRTYEAKASGR